MIRCFYNTIVIFDFINKFIYYYKNKMKAPSFIQIKLVFYLNNLKEILNYIISIKSIKSKANINLLLLNLKAYLIVTLKNKFLISSFLILIIKKSIFINNLFKSLCLYNSNFKLFNLLQISNVDILSNISKYQLNFINIDIKIIK